MLPAYELCAQTGDRDREGRTLERTDTFNIVVKHGYVLIHTQAMTNWFRKPSVRDYQSLLSTHCTCDKPR